MTENGVGVPVFEALSVPHTVNDFVPCVRPASAVIGALDQVYVVAPIVHDATHGLRTTEVDPAASAETSVRAEATPVPPGSVIFA